MTRPRGSQILEDTHIKVVTVDASIYSPRTGGQ